MYMIFAGFGDLARLPGFWLTVFLYFTSEKTWRHRLKHQIFASGTATRRLGKLWEHEKFGQCNAVASTRLKRLEQRSIARAVVSVLFYFSAIIITYTLLLFYLAAVRILLHGGHPHVLDTGPKETVRRRRTPQQHLPAPKHDGTAQEYEAARLLRGVPGNTGNHRWVWVSSMLRNGSWKEASRGFS